MSDNKENLIASTYYGEEITAAVRKNNFIGVQFHPEKSADNGNQLIRNFFKIMKIYPAIDLLEGKVVRLEKGDYNKKKVYSDSPLKVAKNFAKEGAEYIHIVDLSGAENNNFEISKTIESIKSETDLKIQVGGGIRTALQVKRLIGLGVDKVIIGSLAVSEEELFIEILKDFNQNITLALDVRKIEGKYLVATNAWKRQSSLSVYQILDRYMDYGLSQVLCTDISKDGLLKGPNFELYKNLKEKYPKITFLASGGVSSIEDVKTVSEEDFGGVIVGRAIYENKFTLKELFDVS